MLLELGLFPIEDEIAVRHFSFLHHVLRLDDEDMVKIVFKQQVTFEFEQNWRNHIMSLLQKYDLNHELSDIAQMSMQTWKVEVHKAVTKYVLKVLNRKCFNQSKTAYLCPYKDLTKQAYIDFLHPNDARMWLQLRSGIFDLKGNRPYKYNDEVCRGCNAGVEDFDHVGNYCVGIPRSRHLILQGDLDDEQIREGLARFRSFKDLVEENN